MARIPFTNLKLKNNTSTQSFKYGDQEIEVLQYLPFEDKYDLVMIAIQNAEEDNIYNPMKLDMYFNLYLVILYSNISFTDKQKEDPVKLYDMLESNGIIEQVINLIPEAEYNQLLADMMDIIDKKLEARKSVGAIINKFITDMPKQAEAMKNILDNFDSNKYQEVINFAKAANGGRDIN